MIKKILFTKQGLEDLKKEQQDLDNQRKEAVQNLKTAREMGDLSENAAYKVARSKLSSIDSRLRRLKSVIGNAKIVEKTENNIVDIGSFVTVVTNGETQTFQIVGGYESDMSKNKISFYSPVGKALMNRKAGDIVKVKIPSGEIEYQITDIK